jgi:hypothetical protein
MAEAHFVLGVPGIEQRDGIAVVHRRHSPDEVGTRGRRTQDEQQQRERPGMPQGGRPRHPVPPSPGHGHPSRRIWRCVDSEKEPAKLMRDSAAKKALCAHFDAILRRT